MKTNFLNKIGLSALFLVQIIVFTHCSKSNDGKVETTNRTELVSKEDILKIGKLHNEIVSEMLSEFNWDAPDFNKEVILRFNSIDLLKSANKSNYSIEFINERCDIEKNIEVLREKLSPEGFAIFEQGINLCENVVSYESFVNELEKIEKGELISNLPDNEKYTILVSFSIWKNSAYYWLPTNMGGCGEGYAYMDISKRWSLKDALVSDGISGGIGMLGLAVAGACGPIGWTALAIVGGESAVSSVIGGF